MEAKARITDNITDKSEGSYGVSYGSINPRFSYYPDFESAYMAACEYVSWNLRNITIEVYPQFVRDVLKRVTKERVKLMMQEAHDKERAEYLRLKQKFEGDSASSSQ